MLENILPTIFYVLGYVAIFLFLLKQKYDWSVLYIVLIWICSSLYALIFQAMMSEDMYSNITCLPYVFLLVCFILSLIPICKGTSLIKEEYDIRNLDLYKKIMMFFIVISVLPFIENLIHFVSSYGAADTSSLADMYDDKMSKVGAKITWLSAPGRLFNSIDGIFLQFIMFVPFVLLTQKSNSKVFLILSFLPVSNHIVFQLCESGRGTATQFIMVGCFLLLLFRKAIPQRRLKVLKIGMIVVLSFFIAAMSVLTTARRDAHNRGVDNAVVVGYYLAKSHLDFNEKLWYIKKHTEGDNAFGFVKGMLGFYVPANKNEYWTYSKIGVIPSLFYTYIGDWYMDFGAFVTLLLFIVVCKVCSDYFGKRRKTTSMVKLFMFFILCQVVIMGWSINYFKTPGGFRNLLINIVFILFIQSFSKHARVLYEK